MKLLLVLLVAMSDSSMPSTEKVVPRAKDQAVYNASPGTATEAWTLLTPLVGNAASNRRGADP